MSFTAMLKDLGSSAVGLVSKAQLIIHAETEANKVKAPNQQSAAAKALSSGASALSSGAKLGGHVMNVQYNPSSLSIQANAEAIPFKYLQMNVDEGIPNQNLRPPMVVLSVELIFDDVNNQDAFLLERFQLSTGALASNVANLVKKYSVEKQTTALVATVLRPETKLVTFHWGDMAFTGDVFEVQADYTMFSPSGNPIRSVVRLNISQRVESDADAAYWDAAIDKLYKQQKKEAITESK